ncbi:MAG: glycosyltransferase [Thermodesulfobacteriota bacterium]
MAERIAILIPCYNEELTVRAVVHGFRAALPGAAIHVFDNASTDRTAEEARGAGAQVHHVPARGKGCVVRAMFRSVDADLYVMVDGDNTYPPERVAALLEPVRRGEADMVVGARLQQYHEEAFRRLHVSGNRLVVGLINVLFRARLTDALSGYRAFSRRFVKTMPVLSRGFEIETEMTLHALEQGLAIQEVPVPYGSRPAGSHSKLNTYRDGLLLLKTIVSIFKDYRPLLFFSLAGLACLTLGLGFGAIVISEFMATGKVFHPSTAVLAASLFIIGLLSLTTGLILDTVNRRNREQFVLLADHVLAAQEAHGQERRRPSVRP